MRNNLCSKSYLLFLTVAICCFLAACIPTEENITDPSATQDSQLQIPEVTPGTDQEYISPVTIGYLSQMEIDKQSCLQYTDEKLSFAPESIVISTAHTVHDLKFFVLRSDSDTETSKVAEVLYTQQELTPQQPLMIQTSVSETQANRGFCFTDTDGITRYYAYTYDAIGFSAGGILCYQLSI